MHVLFWAFSETIIQILGFQVKCSQKIIYIQNYDCPYLNKLKLYKKRIIAKKKRIDLFIKYNVSTSVLSINLPGSLTYQMDK